MSELTTLMLASDEATMRRRIMTALNPPDFVYDTDTRNATGTHLPSISVAPGALDDVPLIALIQFLAEHGLELHGLTIEKQS